MKSAFKKFLSWPWEKDWRKRLLYYMMVSASAGIIMIPVCLWIGVSFYDSLKINSIIPMMELYFFSG